MYLYKYDNELFVLSKYIFIRLGLAFKDILIFQATTVLTLPVAESSKLSIATELLTEDADRVIPTAEGLEDQTMEEPMELLTEEVEDASLRLPSVPLPEVLDER